MMVFRSLPIMDVKALTPSEQIKRRSSHQRNGVVELSDQAMPALLTISVVAKSSRRFIVL